MTREAFPAPAHVRRPSSTGVFAREGTTLLEMLGYLVIMAVVLNVSAQALISCMRLSHYGSVVADRMGQAAEVEQAFRKAAGQADAVVNGVGAYKTGPGTLVLGRSTAETGVREFTVMGSLRSPESFSKLVLRDEGGELKAESVVTYPLAVRTIAFTYDSADPRNARLVSMDMTTAAARKSSKTEAVRRVTEALRGMGAKTAAVEAPR